MNDPLNLNDLAKRLQAAIPSDLSAVGADLEKNLKAVLQASFSRMDLVTREELEIQQRILEKTRERLKSLEARIERLESDAT